MSNTKLVGILRRSTLNRNYLKLLIHADAFNDCKRYEGHDGEEYVALTLTAGAVRRILDGDGKVTTVVNMQGDDGQ